MTDTRDQAGHSSESQRQTMIRWKLWGILVVLLTVGTSATWAQDPAKDGYPAPRFPSYLRTPKSVEDIMPEARVFAASTNAIHGVGMGKLNPGASVLLVPDITAEEIPLEAVRRALEERRVKVVIRTEAEMVGLTRADADAVRKATYIPNAQKGYLEARNYWIQDTPHAFADPEVPKEWLRQKRPDLYRAMFPKEQEMSPALKIKAEKMTTRNIGVAIRDYLKSHPEISGVYWGKQGGGYYGLFMAPMQSKYMGYTTFANHWVLSSELPTFPADVFNLVEKKTIEMITPDVDKVHVTDPEGTDVSWNVTPEMAGRWIEGIYWRNHLMMYPDGATGQYGYIFDKYPATTKEWIPREPIAMLNGVIAGTNGSGGFYPHVEITYKDGYLTNVKGGGTYGDILREFLKYPQINDLTYPYYQHPGFWHLGELALGTNPKYFRNPSDFFGSGYAGMYCLSLGQYRAGVFHWGFGNELPTEPGSKGLPEKWNKFGAINKLPTAHDFHIHNYFVTYRVHHASTGQWVTIVDRGHLVALDDPAVRELAAKHGDPDRILSEDWIPEIPGINGPGSYAEYSRDPWPVAKVQMEKIIDGSYRYYYPRVK